MNSKPRVKKDDRMAGFRDPSFVLKIALDRFCADTDRSASSAHRLAIRQFLPKKYIEDAEREIKSKRKAAK